MESLFNRYRNLTVLLLALVVQLFLVAYQVKTSRNVRLIRVWVVSAVTPPARLLEAARTSTARFVENYFLLVGARQENRRLMAELDRLKMENRSLRSELATADRAQALGHFQARTPSRTIAARVIGAGAETGSRLILVDRGSAAGVRAGMAVISPDGLVGKVMAVYPTASQVLLVTDPNFAAGVISQKNHVQGTLKGFDRSLCSVSYVSNDEKVEVGEWFYTSGEDRVFPRGLPVGQVKAAQNGKTLKDIRVVPSGLGRGLEEVLVVLEGVHQPLPEAPAAAVSAPLLAPPPAEQPPAAAPEQGGRSTVLDTDADRLMEKYRKSLESQGRAYGDNQPAPAAIPPAGEVPARSAPTRP